MFITITPLHDGVAVQFPKDRALIDAFKARFPKARWGADTKSWHVPGVLAAKRVAKWAAEVELAAKQAAAAAEEARRDAEFEGRALPEGRDYFDALKAEGRKMSTATVAVRSTETEIAVACAYNEGAVRLLRRAGGRWDGAAKRWMFPLAAARALHPVVDEIHAILAPIAAAEARAKAEREAGWAKERAERESRREISRARRYPVGVWEAPGLGDVVRLHGEAVVVTGLGDIWRLDGERYDGIYPPHLWDKQVRYVYHRPATAEEVAAAEAAQLRRDAEEAQTRAEEPARREREARERIERADRELAERRRAIAAPWVDAPDGPTITVKASHAGADHELPVVLPAVPEVEGGLVDLSKGWAEVVWHPEAAVAEALGSTEPLRIRFPVVETIDGREVLDTGRRGRDGRVIKLGLASRPGLKLLASYVDEANRRGHVAREAFWRAGHEAERREAEAQVPAGRVLASFAGSEMDGWITRLALPDGRVIDRPHDAQPIRTSRTRDAMTPTWYAVVDPGEPAPAPVVKPRPLPDLASGYALDADDLRPDDLATAGEA